MIDMTPPPYRSVSLKPVEYKTLRTRDTGTEFILDPEDWKIAREVQWFMQNKQICTISGVSIEKYLKLGKNRKEYTAKYDFRRQNYVV